MSAGVRSRLAGLAAVLERAARRVLPGQAALRRAVRSEERLSLALEAAGMAIWEMDAETGAMWWSDEARRLLGLDPGATASQPRLPHVLQHLHPDDRPAFQAAVAGALARPGEMHRVESRVVWPDGTVRWLEARGQGWRDAGGRLRGLRGTVADVTERKRAEEAVRRGLDERGVIAAVAGAADENALLERVTGPREAFFPEDCGFVLLDAAAGQQRHARSFHSRCAYFTASPIALFVSDAQGRYLEVNGAACALTGYAHEELVGRSIADLLAGDDPRGLGERLVGLLALGAGGSEVRILRKDGTVRTCLVHASAVGSDRMLGMLLDITDRREAEEKLRENEERFRGLSEAAFEAILVHDGGRIVDVNQALCELGGYSWHELAGRDGFDLLAPEYREAVYRNLLAEYERPYEVEVIRRDGTRIPVEVQARSFPYRGQVHRVVAVRDVSERKKAERVRESLIRDLEAKNAELEHFGFAVTHDLKAPLVTIRGFADYLERDARSGRTDRLARDAARITEAVARLQHLLDDLFQLSRAGRPVGPPAAVPAEDLVQDALRLVRGRLEATGGRVDVKGPLPVVHGDRARLVQVLQNLLDNALKFSGGSASPVVTVESRPGEGGQAVLVVRDNGVGIEARHRDRVFELFGKLDPRADGSGVGLALVRRIVESHGGRVWLESEGPGAGTAAVLCLPLAASAATEATAGAGRPRG